ncbi:MAG: transcriptional regulator [Clostridia bacterium]|nr:transcriptional regulator [Clostridia bacterium]
MENSLKYESSFDLCDYMFAKEAFNKWQIEQSCEIDDYIIRKRKAELEKLVRKVIKNELEEKDIVIVNLHWYQGYSQKQIAALLKMEPSTVCRRLEKINNTIYEKLKYAIEYRYGFKPGKDLDFFEKPRLKEDIKGFDGFPLRLNRLRRERYLSLRDLSRSSGILSERIDKLEKGKCTVKISEILIFSEFFGVSTDYLLTGKKGPGNRSEPGGKAV